MLKKILLGLLVIVLMAGGYFLTIMYSTGYFRRIEPREWGEVYQEIPLAGAEDLTIDYENDVMVISTFDRAGSKRGENPTGALYILDLQKQPFNPVRLDDGLGEGFHPHGISLLKLDSNTYKLFVVNHQNRRHTIEEFELMLPNHLVHLRTHEDDMIVSPNDVAALDEGRFYVTNDHKNTEGLALLAENYLGLALSNTIFFDGKSFREAAGGIQYANGVAVSPDKSKLYVASPRGFVIRTYDINSDGSLLETEEIDTNTGVDNLEWDQKGALWVGSHPDLLTFSAYAGLKKPVSPSEVITVTGGNVETVFLDDGSQVSASSVAVPYKEFLFIGTVMDYKILVLRK
jgi:arylesterase/paraoxonase